MLKLKIVLLAVICFLITGFLSGCVVRTYTLTKDRVDQEIVGNRGFIQGNPPAYEGKKKSTRQTTVIEVELGQPSVSDAQPSVSKIK